MSVTADSIVERAKETVAQRTVFIRGNRYLRGVMPMERRLPDGTRNVSSCDYHPHSGKMINVRMVPPLRFGENGVMALDPTNREDQAILEEARLWLAQGDDPRIAQYEIRIEEGGNREGAPIPRYENYKVQALRERIAQELDLIGDDPAEATRFLEGVARYELQRDKPRKMILDAVDELGSSLGTEHGLDEVED